MRARHVMGVAIALATIGGCSSPGPAQVTMNAPVESAPALPACAEVFQPGKVVDEVLATAGCTSPRGITQFVGFFECQDGGILFQVDANTGAPGGYGFGGKQYRVVKGDPAADKSYKQAYKTCLG